MATAPRAARWVVFRDRALRDALLPRTPRSRPSRPGWRVDETCSEAVAG